MKAISFVPSFIKYRVCGSITILIGDFVCVCMCMHIDDNDQTTQQWNTYSLGCGA